MHAANLEDVRKIRGKVKGEFQIHGSVAEMVNGNFLRVAVIDQKLSTVEIDSPARDELP